MGLARVSKESSGFAVEGIGLSTYGVGGYAGSTVADYEANAASSGANTVVLGTVAYVDLATNTIGDAYSGSFDQTAPLSDVDSAIQSAESQGLSVMLKPQMVTSDASYAQYTSGDWINLVDPDLKITNPDAFFSAYKSYILQWAGLAEKDHVASLSIGNEMVAATKPEYTKYWDDIIDSVRQVYHGELTYAALLPVQAAATTNEVTQIGFWNKLDFAGFDVYPSLANHPDPTVAELNASWHSQSVYGQTQDYYSFISALAQEVGKPVVFTETGLPSFQGAADRETSSDGNIGSPSSANSVAPTDYSEQANWWQSFFETWSQDKPSWLQGVVVWNNDPESLGSSYANSYNIIGKPAEGVVASWYGGKLELKPMTDVLTGSQANDILNAYGHATTGSTLAQTLSTTVTISLTASEISGTSPSFDLYINGKDCGKFEIKPDDSGYITSDGVHFVTNQEFSASISGLQAINSVQVVFDGSSQINGTSSTIFFNGVDVNGTALTGLTYTAASGYTEHQTFNSGTSSMWDAGTTSFDPSAWNAALANNKVGTAADPIHVSGGGGTDTLNVLGNENDYAISLSNTGLLTLSEKLGLNQNIVASSISEVQFQNGDKLIVTPNGATSGRGTVFDISCSTNENTKTKIAIPISSGSGTSSIQIDGHSITAGGSVTLASGAHVTLNTNGTLTYDPHGAFNGLVSASTAAVTGAKNTTATDSFVVTPAGGGASHISVAVNGIASSSDHLAGDATNNVIAGTSGADMIDLSQGGSDTATGGAGNDGFYLGAALNAGDNLNGGAGSDQIALQGDYSGVHALTLGAGNLASIESLVLLSGSDTRFGDTAGNHYSYDITSVDANVGAGQQLVVNFNTLAAGENVNFNGSAETDGSFLFYGGLGADHLTGGGQNDGFFFGPSSLVPTTRSMAVAVPTTNWGCKVIMPLCWAPISFTISRQLCC